MPIGDVKDYDKQVGDDKGDRNAVVQGGSSLDWLVFPASAHSGHTMIMPKNYQQIMHYFWKGELDYIKSPDKTVPDKQTIRGLRALLEMPFLTYTPEGMKVIKAELDALIAKGSLDFQAEEQLKKMVRNARFEGAKNRFASSIEGLPADGIEALVQQLSAKHSSAKMLEFMVKRDPALRRGEDKGGFAEAGVLMSVEAFIKDYTDNGFLYHGTPDFTNVLNMIRNGMVFSKEGQGLSAFGRGVYTDKSRATPERYAKDTGVVLELQVHPKGLRVLDWESAKNRPEIIKLFPNASTANGAELDAIFEQLTIEYDIDIIINSYPLIQNAAAIKLPKKSRDIIKLQIQQAENSLKAYMQQAEKPNITKKQITQWFNYLHPKGQFAKFAKVLGIAVIDDMSIQMTQALLKYLRANDGNSDDIYKMALSHGRDYWQSDLIKKEIEQIESELNNYMKTADKQPISQRQITQFFNYLHPKGKFAQFAGVLGIAVIDGMSIQMTQTLLLKYLRANDTEPEDAYDMVLSHGKGYWSNEAEKRVYADAFATYATYMMVTMNRGSRVHDETTKSIISLKRTGIRIVESSLRDIVSTLNSAKNITAVADAVISLKNAGCSIMISYLTDIIPVLDNVKNIGITTKSIIALKQAGMNISTYDLKNLLPLLDKIQITEQILANIKQLRGAGIDITVYNLKDLIPVLDQSQTIENVTLGLTILKKAGFDFSAYDPNVLIPVFDPIKIKNIENVPLGLSTLKQAGFNMPSRELGKLIPVLANFESMKPVIDAAIINDTSLNYLAILTKLDFLHTKINEEKVFTNIMKDLSSLIKEKKPNRPIWNIIEQITSLEFKELEPYFKNYKELFNNHEERLVAMLMFSEKHKTRQPAKKKKILMSDAELKGSS